MSRPHQVEPKWVKVNGELHHVSEFAALLLTERPRSICPVCERRVVLKLGSKMVHHYAHEPGDTCAATQPETALHLNTKFYLYQQLQATKSLVLKETCIRCRRTERPYTLLDAWDEVAVETAVGAFRPDIILRQADRVVGAIEVFVTHAVEAAKVAFFRSEQIAWVEVQAAPELYEGETAWTPSAPLPFMRRGPEQQPWVCTMCEEASARAAASAEHRQNNYVDIHAAKMVDFYYPTGKKRRETYFVKRQVREGEEVKVWVETEKGTVLASHSGPLTKEATSLLNQAVERELEKWRHRPGARVDEVVKWKLWEDERFLARATDKYPFRYEWDQLADTWKEAQPSVQVKTGRGGFRFG